LRKQIWLSQQPRQIGDAMENKSCSVVEQSKQKRTKTKLGALWK
jgi:hypothetical protein